MKTPTVLVANLILILRYKSHFVTPTNFKIPSQHTCNLWCDGASILVCRFPTSSKPLHQLCVDEVNQRYHREFSSFTQHGISRLRQVARHDIVTVSKKMRSCPTLQTDPQKVLCARCAHALNLVENGIEVLHPESPRCLCHEILQVFGSEI